MPEVVKVFIGTTSAGEDSFEPLLVTALPDGLWRLERSPLLATGIARGDTIRIDDGGRTVALVEGGGRYAVQLYYPRPLVIEDLRGTEESLADLGGEVDAHARSVMVVSFPESTPLSEVAARLGEHAQTEDDVDWYVSREPLTQ